jgi:DNA-binding XRE family transcriptional regulator
MNLQTIKSSTGKIEYVLLPYPVYRSLKLPIEKALSKTTSAKDADFVPFDPADYIDNPVALARIKAHIRQTELAKTLGVSQAYLSKVENQQHVSPKLLSRVHESLKTLMKKR